MTDLPILGYISDADRTEGEAQLALEATNTFIRDKFGSKSLAVTAFTAAATVDLTTCTGEDFTITGATAITSFGSLALGVKKKGRCLSAGTITHNATSLICPGAANLNVLAGDTFEVMGLGSGNVVIVDFQRAAGIPGAVLQVKTYTDAGSASASTTMVNANGSAFSFAPKSANSTLIIIASAYCSIGAVAATNTIGQVEIRESGSLVGSTYSFSAAAVSDGVAWQGPVTIQVALPNSAVTARTFALYHKSSTGSASVSTTLIKWTIIEIAN